MEFTRLITVNNECTNTIMGIRDYMDVYVFMLLLNFDENILLSTIFFLIEIYNFHLLISKKYLHTIPAQLKQALLQISIKEFSFSMSPNPLYFVCHVFTYCTFFLNHLSFYFCDFFQLNLEIDISNCFSRYLVNIMLCITSSKQYSHNINSIFIEAYIYLSVQVHNIKYSLFLTQYGK